MKFVILIILTLIIVPISGVIPIHGQPIWTAQYLALFFMFFIGIAMFLWDFNKYLSLFLSICLISTYFITHCDIRAIMILTQLNLACLASYGISRLNYTQRKFIVYGILALVAIQVIWLGVQFMNKDPFFSKIIRPVITGEAELDIAHIAYGQNVMVGFSGSKAQLGSFFAITAPLFTICPILLIIPLTCVYLAKSTFSILALLPLLICWWFMYRKSKIAIMIIVLLLLGIGLGAYKDNPTLASFKVRQSVWSHSINAVKTGNIMLRHRDTFVLKANPWYGYGFGQFLKIFPSAVPDNSFDYNVQDEKFTHAHNDFVEIFFELGYMGLFALILLFGNFIYGFIRGPKTKERVIYFSSLMSYLIFAFGYFPSHLAISGLLFIIFYGLYRGALDGIIPELVE